jgi:hypothetical protein
MKRKKASPIGGALCFWQEMIPVYKLLSKIAVAKRHRINDKNPSRKTKNSHFSKSNDLFPC